MTKDHPEFSASKPARSGEHRSNSLFPWNVKTSLTRSHPSEKEEDPKKIRYREGGKDALSAFYAALEKIFGRKPEDA